MTQTSIFRRTDDKRTAVRSRIALSFVFAAVVALVAVPWAGARLTRPLYMDLTEVLAPARGLVTRINAALALEGSLLRDYVTSRDPHLTQRYRAAYASELAATESLTGLTGRLGERPKTALADFQRVQQEWHDLIERLLLNPSALSERDPLRGREYEGVLNAVLRLDAELEASGQHRRGEILRLEMLQSRIAIGLGLLGAAAAVVVGWLAQRVSVYAARLQEGGIALERAIESRARLMRGITHDLKNPLHSIDGHAQLLEDGVRGPLLPGQRDSVVRVRRSVATMLGLIDDLLDLARAEAGQLRITPHPVDVVRVVRDTVEEHRALADLSGHTLDVESDGPLPAHTDARRVCQILGNLLSNAIKYSPRGSRIGVRLEVRDRAATGGQDRWIAIDVSDNGSGIPVEQQEAIFADFTRLDAHSELPGAGLGLSISRRVAKLLGGALTLESTPGKGATFTLWLPRDRRQPTASVETATEPLS